MPDILDISKRKARDIHLESDLGHLMENCFVQSSLSKLQETIVLHVLRVPHVLLLTRPARSTLPHTVTCSAIAWRKAQKWLHPVSSGAPRSSKDSVVKDQCYPEGFGADSWSRSNFTPRRNRTPLTYSRQNRENGNIFPFASSPNVHFTLVLSG